MVAQSSASDNDNLEIGTKGSEIEIYLDSGTGAQDMTYTTSGANITNNNWHHLVVTYGSDLKVFSDGTEVLQIAYDGPLDSNKDSRFLWEWLESSRISGAISMDRLTILEFTVRS